MNSSVQSLASPNVDPWLAKPVRIESVTTEVVDVATYQLAFVDPGDAADYRFRPGQFNMLYLPGAGEMPISLSAEPAETHAWAHTIRVVGNVTRTLANLTVGETLGLRGPFGTSWPLDENIGHDIILVAGGIGLAPLRPAIYELIARRREFSSVTLLYGARSPDVLLFSREFVDWSDAGIDVQTTVDRAPQDWQGNVGFVIQLLERLQRFDPANVALMCCGPEVMMKYTATSALARGMTRRQIWISMERNMQCAVGHCGHCQLGSAFICKDGPVFRYDLIDDFMDVEGL